MKLQDQVCTLEQARKLKSLNVKQESLFNWQEIFDLDISVKPYKRVATGETKVNLYCDNEKYSNIAAAYTVAELGEFFPKNVQLPFKSREQDLWVYSTNEGRMYAYTEAEARAKMLIYLLENDIITL